MEAMLVALYDNLLIAYIVILNLRQRGFEASQIGFLMQDFREQRENQAPIRRLDREKLPVWADYEVLLESLNALLSGMRVVTVHSIGPVLAAGFLADTRDGFEQAAADLPTLFDGVGLSGDEAGAFQEGLQQAKPLITLFTDSAIRNRAATIMQAFAPIRLVDSDIDGVSTSTNETGGASDERSTSRRVNLLDPEDSAPLKPFVGNRYKLN